MPMGLRIMLTGFVSKHVLREFEIRFVISDRLINFRNKNNTIMLHRKKHGCLFIDKKIARKKIFAIVSICCCPLSQTVNVIYEKCFQHWILLEK